MPCLDLYNVQTLLKIVVCNIWLGHHFSKGPLGIMDALWFKFFFGLKFSNQFNFYFPLLQIHYHLQIHYNLRHRKIKINLVWKFSNQRKNWTTTEHCINLAGISGKPRPKHQPSPVATPIDSINQSINQSINPSSSDLQWTAYFDKNSE